MNAAHSEAKPPLYLSVKEVSTTLGVSRGCIYELVEKGRLPHVRIGMGRGTIRILSSALEEYLSEASPSPSRKAKRFGKRSFEHLDTLRLADSWNSGSGKSTK